MVIPGTCLSISNDQGLVHLHDVAAELGHWYPAPEKAIVFEQSACLGTVLAGIMLEKNIVLVFELAASLSIPTGSFAKSITTLGKGVIIATAREWLDIFCYSVWKKSQIHLSI